jgi:hypothetical protein
MNSKFCCVATRRKTTFLYGNVTVAVTATASLSENGSQKFGLTLPTNRRELFP